MHPYVHPVRSFLFLHVTTTPALLNWLAILLVLLMGERRVFLVAEFTVAAGLALAASQ